MTRMRSPLREAAVLGAEDQVAPAVPVLVGLPNCGLVDVDAEARTLRHRQIAVDGSQRLLVGAEVQEIVAAGIVMDAEADFLDGMVRRAGRDLQAGPERQRPKRAMGSDGDVIGL